MRAVLQSRLMPADVQDNSTRIPARQITIFLLFAAVVCIASVPWLSPTYLLPLPALSSYYPRTDLRLLNPPLALLSVALTLRPKSEAPIFVGLYALAVLGVAEATSDLSFALVRVPIEIAQTLVQVAILNRMLNGRWCDPKWMSLYAVSIVALTAVGAILTVAIADAASFPHTVYVRQLGGEMGLGWRVMWLCNACSYLSIAGSVATLLRAKPWVRAAFQDRADRRDWIGMTGCLLIASLVCYPLFNPHLMSIPPDVELARRTVPTVFVLAMAARFRTKGAAVALLIYAPIALYSIGGPTAGSVWTWPPALATPTLGGVLTTTIASIVVAAIAGQLRRALALAVEANEVKSRFIGLMSHELRTPLNAILGFSELMRMQSLREFGEAVAAVDNIHASGQRLLAMIEAVLSHAERHDGIFALHKQPLRLQQAVVAATMRLNEQFPEHGCSIDIDVPDDLLIEADARALRQILQVIIGYPLRFCSRGSEISIYAGHEGTDTIIDIYSSTAGAPVPDEIDKVEFQLVNALALAHGARLSFKTTGNSGRTARLRFFATRAA